MWLLLALLCGVTTLSARPQKPAAPDVNIGASLNLLPDDFDSCASWAGARRDKNTDQTAALTEGVSRAWIWGFVSGASVYGRRPLGHLPSAALDAWVDKYCADHPRSRLVEAMGPLVEELAARKPAVR